MRRFPAGRVLVTAQERLAVYISPIREFEPLIGTRFAAIRQGFDRDSWPRTF